MLEIVAAVESALQQQTSSLYLVSLSRSMFLAAARDAFWKIGLLSATARLAQSAERKALNLVVVGSSPTVGAFPMRQVNAPSVMSRVSA